MRCPAERRGRRPLNRGAFGEPKGRGLPPAPPARWIDSPLPDPVSVRVLEKELRLPKALCSLLVSRGFADPASAKAFLRPLLTSLHPPELLPDLSQAVARIERAIRGGEIILVHGDYDVDGMAGAALLTRWLRRLGGRVKPFVPNRVTEGYDLGPAGLEAASGEGASLILTVDCGIVAFEAVDEASGRGIDVIVTDHHEPGPVLPNALAVLNPARRDSDYPEASLSGTGVAFKLCQALAAQWDLPEEELHPSLDLVGLATIADLVPLIGENRVLARFGLKALAQTRNPGLLALMSEAGVAPGEISAGTVGFALAPRLNAIGRLGDPALGLQMLLTDDPSEARALAHQAGTLNAERQAADRRILDEALEQLSGLYDPERDFGVVLASEGWHPGVIGIVASRITERIHRPVVMVALDGEWGRGSGRSIPEFDLLAGIRACGAHLERYGGHKQAAGVELAFERLDGFRAAFNEVARRELEGKELRPALRLELEVEVGDLSQELHRFLQYLGPHGIGNPEPVLVARGLTLAVPARTVGTGHLKLLLQDGAERLEAIGFGLADRISPEELGAGPVDVAFHLQENRYRGVRRLQARLRDLRPGEAP